MIKMSNGNLLKADAEALVNTVNCVGFMGKGIALQFKQAFPSNNKFYEAACRAEEVQPGKMLVYDNGRLRKPHYIINFPTKRHWRGDSRIEDIQAGLPALISEVKRLKITSIAVPPLGCGLGGLDWDVVKPMIEKAFAELPEVRVMLFEPKGAPPAKEMPINTSRPKITTARALLIKLMSAYTTLDYSQSLLEVQKLAYFLQESGEPLRLNYEAGKYGPFAPNLYKVLEMLEGHFIRGYGSTQKPGTEIELLPGAVEEASDFLRDKHESQERLGRVSKLIEGFETPYGMELLATVHWVATHGGPKGQRTAKDPEDATTQVHTWNPRKRQIFKSTHIRKAWATLDKQGWLSRPSETAGVRVPLFEGLDTTKG
jgi:O-acetyl-ADP-ribose deacetylase (regulator of RNase III)